MLTYRAVPIGRSMPAYRYHVSGQAVVTFCGRDYYLGLHNSLESQAKYRALVAEYQRNGFQPPNADAHQGNQPITVRCVVAGHRANEEKAVEAAKAAPRLGRIDG